MAPQALQNVKITDQRAIELIEEVFARAKTKRPTNVAINRQSRDVNAGASALLDVLYLDSGALELSEDEFRVLIAHEAGHIFHKHARVGVLSKGTLEALGYQVNDSILDQEKEADDFAAGLYGRLGIIQLLKASQERNLKELREYNEERQKEIDTIFDFIGLPKVSIMQSITEGMSELQERLAYQEKQQGAN